MTSRKIAMVLSLGSLALTPVLSRSAAAQAVSPQPGFVGMTKASVAGCPNIGWRLARHADGTVTGLSYYADASGASSVNGTYDKDGSSILKLYLRWERGLKGQSSDKGIRTVVGRRPEEGAGC